jgi:broad specificity phosphatase PhoE
MNARRWLLSLAMGVIAMPIDAQTTCAPTAVYLVRHAEKASASGDPDVELSDAGRAGANALADWMEPRPLDAIYSTHLRRTQQTALPTAAARDLDLRVLPASATARLLERLRTRHCDQHVLVVGHSNTVPEIAVALGAEPFAIDESEYGAVYVVDGRGGAMRRESYRDVQQAGR